MLSLAGFVCGFIFGLGLLISGMTQPTKVLNFLDLFRRVDPSLAVVMAVALGGVGIGFRRSQTARAALRPQNSGPRGRTSTAHCSPVRRCSASAGIGWISPGPALENLGDAVAANHSSSSAWRPECVTTISGRHTVPPAPNLLRRASWTVSPVRY